MRKIVPLTTGWRFAGPAETLQEALAAPAAPVTVPHTWNAEDGACGKNYFRGKHWYLLDIDISGLGPDEEYWIEFLGASQTAEVYLNGQRMTVHSGGYTAFRVDLTPALRQNDLLAVSVDNRPTETVYPQTADFTFYGGLYREVRGIIVPKEHFALGNDGDPGIRVTPTVEGDSAKVTVEFRTEGSPRSASVEVDGAVQTVPITDNYGKAEFVIHNAHLWQGREDPYLYTATASLSNGDTVSARFGCRSITFDPEKGFFLNGKSYPLRGVARHQDREGVGCVLTEEMQREDMEIIAEMGANTIRLAHYPHHPYFYDLCDEYGMVVWAEIPYISRHMTDGRQNTLDQMRELVRQQYNHPSIVCWGLSNEISMLSDLDDDLMENHRLLNDLCHELDATRPTTMAHVGNCPMDHPIQQASDLRSFNIYYGWYYGSLEDNGPFLDRYHAMHPDLCVGLSEYGADANPAYQSASPRQGDYSESYQAVYHEAVLEAIEARPYLWATHVWNMFDFGASNRNEGGNPGKNQKGLVTMDRKIRKDAYYLYKAHWSSEPFVHICGRRYVDRTEDETEIKVYTNQPCVSLTVNGRPAGTQKGQYLFRFTVPLTGEAEITARAGDCTDTIHIRKVEEPNSDYVLPAAGSVVNWFDQDSFKAGFWSIKDPITALIDCPAIHDRVADFCQKMSPGFVLNDSLMRAFGQNPLESMIQRSIASVDEEEVKALNAFLQRTPKPEQ